MILSARAGSRGKAEGEIKRSIRTIAIQFHHEKESRKNLYHLVALSLRVLSAPS